MALKKSQKEEIVKEFEGVVKDSKSIVFLNFHCLNVGDETVLRRGLREKGVNYKVGRKTLLKRAFAGRAEGEMPELPGEVAIAYLSAEALAKEGGNDQLAPAREVYNFGKSRDGILRVLGGIFEGKFVGAEMMTEIATIPSREVLLSKLAFLLQSPMQRLAIAVSEVAKDK